MSRGVSHGRAGPGHFNAILREKRISIWLWTPMRDITTNYHKIPFSFRSLLHQSIKFCCLSKEWRRQRKGKTRILTSLSWNLSEFLKFLRDTLQSHGYHRHTHRRESLQSSILLFIYVRPYVRFDSHKTYLNATSSSIEIGFVWNSSKKTKTKKLKGTATNSRHFPSIIHPIYFRFSRHGN